MVIKLLTIDLHLPGRSSLKQKRFVLSSIKTKIGRQPNVGIAETGYQDKWQRSTLAVVVVGSHNGAADATIERILGELERDHRFVVLEHRVEDR